MANPLSNKQKKFCEEYIIDFNGTQAAIRAGYSEKTANPISAQNLAKLSIQSYVQELMKQREKRTEITADMVVKELAKVAFFDIRKIFHKDGGLINPLELDEDTAKAISAIKSKDVPIGDGMFETVKEYKSNDKLKALELLGKHLGVFENRIKQDEENTTPIKRVTIMRRSDTIDEL